MIVDALPGMVNAVMLVRCVEWEVIVESDMEEGDDGEEEEGGGMSEAGDKLTISLQVADHTGKFVSLAHALFISFNKKPELNNQCVPNKEYLTSVSSCYNLQSHFPQAL